MEKGWKLDETAKKDLLQRIALAMQEEGAQTWSVSRALEIVSQLVPAVDGLRGQRAKKYLDWAADHTGILRFQEGSKGEEHIRFWHRIFREYLSAHRLAQEDTTAGEKISKLRREGRLTNPFWEDVVRLLPRTLGTIEKAKSIRERLEQLAEEDVLRRGRLLGLSAAAIIENRDLFPDVHFAAMAKGMAELYDREGASWPIIDRLLFLDGLGRLDPDNGDPRLLNERWIYARRSIVRPRKDDSKSERARTGILWVQVTVQQFRNFVRGADFKEPSFWSGFPGAALKYRDESLLGRIEKQYRHPNCPVVNVSLFEALAYCRWRTKARDDGLFVRLPTPAEWQRFCSPPLSAADKGVGENACVNLRGAGIGRPSPVGAFPPHHCGACDLIGNVWEYGLPEGASKAEVTSIPVLGLSFELDSLEGGAIARATGNVAFKGHHSIGFRPVLSWDNIQVATIVQID